MPLKQQSELLPLPEENHFCLEAGIPSECLDNISFYSSFHGVRLRTQNLLAALHLHPPVLTLPTTQTFTLLLSVDPAVAVLGTDIETRVQSSS